MTTPTMRLSMVETVESLPPLLGHTPHNSIVLLLLNRAEGAEGNVAGLVRADMPTSAEHIEPTVATLYEEMRTRAAGHDWTGAVAVIWDESQDTNPLATEVTHDLELMVHNLGRETYGVFLVNATHITGVGRNGQESVHVDEKRDPSRADKATLNAIENGRAPLTSREAVAATVEAIPNTGLDYERIHRLSQQDHKTTRAAALPLWLDVVDNGSTEDTDVEMLAASVLYDRELRDGVVAYANASIDGLLDTIEPTIAEPIRNARRTRTREEGLAVVENLRELVTRMDDGLAEATLAILVSVAHEAHLAILAIVALERIERTRPTYYLAQLMRQMVDHGIYMTDANRPLG